MKTAIKDLAIKIGCESIKQLVDKSANAIVNPEIYDPMQQKQESKLKAGLNKTTASAPVPKVLAAV